MDNPSTPEIDASTLDQRPTVIDLWEPGDGNRYDLMLVTGRNGRGVFIWLNGPPRVRGSMRLPDKGSISPSYLAEKMGLRPEDESDTAALLAWLKRHNISCWLPDGFDANGNRVPVAVGGAPAV